MGSQLTNKSSVAGEIVKFAGATLPAGHLWCDGGSYSASSYPVLARALWNGSNYCWGGSGTFPTGSFNVPDLRGRFPRGVDGSAGIDPDKVSRPASKAGGNTGNNVGTIQAQKTAKNGLTNSTSTVTGVPTGSITGSQGMSVTINTSGSSHRHYIYGTGLGGGGWPGDNTPNYSLGEVANPNNSGHYHGTNYNNPEGDTSIHTHGGTVSSVNFANAAFNGSGISGGIAAAQTISGDSETRPENVYVNYIIRAY